MKLFLLHIFLFSISVNTYGQSTSLDSLDQLIENSQYKNSQTIWAAAKVAYDTDPDKVKKYTDFLINLKEVKEDSFRLIKTLNHQALADRKLGNYPNSISNFKITYQYFKSHNDSLSLAAAADQLGTMNTFLGNMKAAQPYVIEAYSLYKSLDLKKEIASCTNGLAIFYNDLGDTPKAISKYNEALHLYQDLNDTLGQANVHANLGLTYIGEKKYDLAEYHLKMQGKLDTLLDTQWGLGFHHDFMGYLMRKQGKFEEALASHQRSLAIRLKLDSHYNLAETRSGLASIYHELGEYQKSIIQANLILEHKIKHESLTQEQNAYRHLSKAYEGLGEYKTSLKFHKLYKSSSDSIYNRNLLEEITEKDAIHERSIQDNKIVLLNEKNLAHQKLLGIQKKILLIGGIGLAILTFLLYSLFKLYKSLRKNKERLVKTLEEKNILLREIHHRVKNNLQLISSLLTLQGRSIEDESAIKAINDGRNRVRSMALIHQDLYNKENLTDINVKDYLEKLCRELFKTYSIDQNLIQLELNIENLDIDIDTIVPLGLIINELITNTLKYAFPKNDVGVLTIKFYINNDNYCLVIKDNGVGYDQSIERPNSFGSTLLSALTAQLGGDMTIDSAEGTMTQLVFKRA